MGARFPMIDDTGRSPFHFRREELSRLARVGARRHCDCEPQEVSKLLEAYSQANSGFWLLTPGYLSSCRRPFWILTPVFLSGLPPKSYGFV